MRKSITVVMIFVLGIMTAFAAPGKRIVVNFWHSSSGVTGEAIMAQAKLFNESQDKITVVPTYQGSYDETTAKLQQSIPAKTQPAIAMLERSVVPQYIDNGLAQDLTGYMKKTHFDPSVIFDGFLSQARANGKIYGLPYIRSTPILYYNKTLFAKAGLDPNRPPATWDECLEYARKLTKKDSSGKTVQYGVGMAMYDTWITQGLVVQAGGHFFNKDMTDIGFNNEIGKKVFNYIKAFQKDGTIRIPPVQNAFAIQQQDFVSGLACMTYGSTGGLSAYISEAKNNGFEVGVGFMPKNVTYGTPTGGANIIMLAPCSDEVKDAAWTFMSWLMEADQAAYISAKTGYMPVTKTAANSKIIQDLWAKYPQYKVAFEQLEYVEDPTSTPVWTQLNREGGVILQKIYIDQSITPEEGLKEMSEMARDLLSETY